MPEFADRGEDLGFGVAGPDRVLGLQRRDRMHGVGAADGGRRRLGQTEVAHLARRHELGHGPDGLLDRRVGVDPVLVVEIDVVGPQPGQRRIAGLPHVLRPAVDGARGRILGVAHVAELGGDDRLVAARPQGPAEEDLVGEGPVHVGGVEEGQAQIEGAVDGGDRLVVVTGTVELGHAHAAETLARHDEPLTPEGMVSISW